MTSTPFINTSLSCLVALSPSQQDNKLEINLKKNVEHKLLNKAYKDYGVVTKVYKIIKHSEGILEAENFSGSALFQVEVSVKLCRPLNNQSIVCKISKVNKELIILENGPILIIIANRRMNNDVFFIDNNNNIKYRKNNESYVLSPNDYVIANIMSVTFSGGDNKIKALGTLTNLATEEDIKKHFDNLYNDEKIIEYSEYIES